METVRDGKTYLIKQCPTLDPHDGHYWAWAHATGTWACPGRTLNGGSAIGPTLVIESSSVEVFWRGEQTPRDTIELD